MVVRAGPRFQRTIFFENQKQEKPYYTHYNNSFATRVLREAGYETASTRRPRDLRATVRKSRDYYHYCIN